MAMPPTPNPRQPLRPSSPLVRYGLALLIAGLTVAIRWWLEPLVGSRHAFLGGNLAVALVAYRYGTGPALAAVNALAATVFNRDLPGPLARLRAKDGPVDFRVHAHYNPENITQFNVVPGLMGVVLTMTMVIITALAITRERERGTMENLLATPVRPFEVIVGKILPYIVVGYIQVSLILVAAHFVFDVPMVGSLPLLYVVSLLFIAANLAVGITFSTLAKNQLQAVQMAFFFFLPSILLSGFMFPFRGMPDWAQAVGSCLPNTHFLRIVRGILLKGNGFSEIAPHLWPLLVFLVIAMTIGVKRYRQTLD